MPAHRIVSKQEWLKARKRFLTKEKQFTRLRDKLSKARRALPWERVEKEYVFEGGQGRETLSDLFDGKSQLIVYHFMLAPGWEAGCKSCSFWADNFNGIGIHLAQRDTALVAISRAPYRQIAAFKKRLGWDFPWVSSHGNDFNYDYHVSFRPEELEKGEGIYNYEKLKASMTELPGISIFFRDERGKIFHTYSTYARGLDMLNTAYHYLDLTPKGRDEDKLPHTMAWVRHHDKYGT